MLCHTEAQWLQRGVYLQVSTRNLAFWGDEHKTVSVHWKIKVYITIMALSEWMQINFSPCGMFDHVITQTINKVYINWKLEQGGTLPLHPALTIKSSASPATRTFFFQLNLYNSCNFSKNMNLHHLHRLVFALTLYVIIFAFGLNALLVLTWSPLLSLLICTSIARE